jgi:hypothetical protein
VREASWDEFDKTMKEWTIPAARMKGKNGRARPTRQLDASPLQEGLRRFR